MMCRRCLLGSESGEKMTPSPTKGSQVEHILRDKIRRAVPKVLNGLYSYIVKLKAEEVNGADAVAEEAVRALAHWNGSDFADAVFQQLQDVLREDFVKLVQEEMASGASNVVMVLSSAPVQEAITRFRGLIQEEMLAALQEVRDTKFLSELEEDNEDEAPAEEGFAKGFGFGQSPGAGIGGGGFVSVFSLGGEEDGEFEAEGWGYGGLQAMVKKLTDADLGVRIQALTTCHKEDLSELNYSDKWPMVCEALASFLPLQQHPQAQTKAIELLLGAFEILSPQQSGDVYLAVLHHLITTMRTQAVAVEGVVHEDEDPMLWRLLRALLKMQDKLPELFLGMPDMVTCRVVCWTFVLLRTISTSAHGLSSLSPWHLCACLDPTASWFRLWCLRLPPPQLLGLLQDTGLLPDLLHRATHGPSFPTPADPPACLPSYLAPKSSTLSIPASLLSLYCRTHALAMLAHLATTLPPLSLCAPPSSCPFLPSTQLPPVPDGIKLETIQASNMLHYHLKTPLPSPPLVPSVSSPPPLLSTLLQLFTTSLTEALPGTQLGDHTNAWEGLLNVALEGLVIVARRSANTATAQSSSAADTDAHTALQPILDVLCTALRHATAPSPTTLALCTASLQLIDLLLDLPLGPLTQLGPSAPSSGPFSDDPAALPLCVHDVLHHAASLLPTPDPQLSALADRLIARLACHPSPVAIGPSLLLSDTGPAQRDPLLTVHLLTHWLGSTTGVGGLEMAGVLGPVAAHVWEELWGRKGGPTTAEKRAMQVLTGGASGMTHLAACGALPTAAAFLLDLPRLYGPCLTEALGGLRGETPAARDLLARLEVVMLLGRGLPHILPLNAEAIQEDGAAQPAREFLHTMIEIVQRWDCHPDDVVQCSLRVLLSTATTCDGALLLSTPHPLPSPSTPSPPSLLEALQDLCATPPPHSPTTLSACALLRALTPHPTLDPRAVPIPPPYHTNTRLDAAITSAHSLPLSTSQHPPIPGTPLPPVPPQCPTHAPPPLLPLLQALTALSGPLTPHSFSGLLPLLASPLAPQYVSHGSALADAFWSGITGRYGGLFPLPVAPIFPQPHPPSPYHVSMAAWAVGSGRIQEGEKEAFALALERLHIQYEGRLEGRPAWCLLTLLVLAWGKGPVEAEAQVQKLLEILSNEAEGEVEEGAVLFPVPRRAEAEGMEEDEEEEEEDDAFESLAEDVVGLLVAFQPEALAAFEARGLVCGPLLCAWLRQGLWGVLSWTGVGVYTTLALLGGRQYQVFFGAALLLAVREQQAKHTPTRFEGAEAGGRNLLHALEWAQPPPGVEGRVLELVKELAIWEERHDGHMSDNG